MLRAASANQLLSETTTYSGLAGSRAVGYAYNMDGRRSQLAYPDGTVVDYTHTPRGQLAAITADGPPPLAAFTYDPSGLPLTRTLENNTSTAYAYDGAGRLLSVAHSGNGTALRTIAYTLDPNGRRTSREDNGALEIYGYDPTGQLTSVSNSTNATYTYDPVGNRQSVTGAVPGSGTYLADALNRYTAAPGGGATYDPRGNLVAHAGRTIAYDSRNRLVSATVAGHTVTTIYDHRNRAVKRTVDGTATYFVWDDWSLIAELDASGAELQRYIQGPGIDNIIAKTNSAGTVYYHQDGLGSTVALTDAAGAFVETYTYDAFGAVRILDPSTLATRPSSPFGNRFLFTGREWIAEAGLYDYRNRAYDPELGRFLQTDPIRFDAGDVNLYRYVSNNPANWVDPYGLQKRESDDFGRTCCPSEMKQVSIDTHPTRDPESDWGHASLTTPNQCAGFYPANGASKENPTGPGEVRNDKPFGDPSSDHTGQKTFRACPESLKSIDDYIDKSRKTPPNYDATNGSLTQGGKNCYGWATDGITGAGGKAPIQGTVPDFSTK